MYSDFQRLNALEMFSFCSGDLTLQSTIYELVLCMISLFLLALEEYFFQAWICRLSFPSPVIMLKFPDREPPARSRPCTSTALGGLIICWGWGQEPGGKIWGSKEGVWAHERCSQQKAGLGNEAANLHAKRELCTSDWTSSEEDVFLKEMTKYRGKKV